LFRIINNSHWKENRIIPTERLENKNGHPDFAGCPIAMRQAHGLCYGRKDLDTGRATTPFVRKILDAERTTIPFDWKDPDTGCVTIPFGRKVSHAERTTIPFAQRDPDAERAAGCCRADGCDA